MMASNPATMSRPWDNMPQDARQVGRPHALQADLTHFTNGGTVALYDT